VVEVVEVPPLPWVPLLLSLQLVVGKAMQVILPNRSPLL